MSQSILKLCNRWKNGLKVFLALPFFFVRLMALGPEDNVAEYYQQQVEMLEGFNEMDALAERVLSLEFLRWKRGRGRGGRE